MKRRFFLKSISFLLVLMLSLAAVPLCASAAGSGNIYYVSQAEGSDDNEGSESAPFATISHAASVMKAGDTCYIRGGVYREELRASLSGTEDSPIRFLAYEDETVTISGADPVTGWEKYQGNIYVADMDWDVYADGIGNMVFADGALMTEARWPNATTGELLDRSHYAKVDSVQVGQTAERVTITDSDLPQVDLTGSVFWCAADYSYLSFLWSVTENSGTSFTATTTNVGSSKPAAGNLYYLTRSLNLLDAEQEWYKDTANDKLYFYAPGGVNPDTLSVEARKREYAIYLQSSDYVSFEGINVRGGLVYFADSTSHCSFKDAVAESLDYKMNNKTTGAARGIVVKGSYNTVSGCEIKNMFGEGITVEGNYNRLLNNYIHDINFEHTYSDGIYITGANNLVSHNTVTRTGRGTIGGRFDSCVISYNDLSEPNKLSKDSGVIYLNAHDYKNSEIHHNVIHDSLDSEGLQFGFYLDSLCTSVVVYQNLIYNCEFTEESLNGTHRSSVLIGGKGYDVLFINNTVVNIMDINNYEADGRVFLNNLFQRESGLTDFEGNSGSYYRFNMTGEDMWQNPAANDYTLSADSEAIDSALVVPGINDDFIGAAPDCGAFEYGRAAWQAGHDFSKSYDEDFALNEAIPFRNVLTNSGFESGTAAPWQTEAGSPAVIDQSSWEYWNSLTKDGSGALMLHDGDKLSYSLTGLKPNSDYRVSGFGKISGEYVPCTEYDGTSMSSAPTNSNILKHLSEGWLQYDEVDFKDGSIDQIMLALRVNRLTSGSYNADVKVCLDSTENTIASYHIDGSYDDNFWTWQTLNLSQTVSGKHTVYICFSGTLENLYFGGFYQLSSTSQDVITFKAALPDGTSESMSFDAKTSFTSRQDFIIKTDASGVLNLSLEKSGGVLCGYLDTLSVREEMEVPAAAKGFELLSLYAAENGSRTYCLQGGRSYSLTAKVKNISRAGLKLAGSLVTESGQKLAAQNYYINGGEEKTLTISAQLPESAGEVKLLLQDKAGTLGIYPLTEAVLEQLGDNEGFILKASAIRNSAGEKLTKLQRGDLNVLEVRLTNFEAADMPMQGILAIYAPDGKLSELESFHCSVPAKESAVVGLGAQLPDEDGVSVKLFIWQDNEDLIPLIQKLEFSAAESE